MSRFTTYERKRKACLIIEIICLDVNQCAQNKGNKKNFFCQAIALFVGKCSSLMKKKKTHILKTAELSGN